MKREIKFRGQRKMNGEWVFGSLISIGEDWDQIIPLETEYDDLKQEMTRVMTHSIGQFTGLTDKNGVEIYEGDIVNSGYFKNAAVVFWEFGWTFERNECYHNSFNTARHTFEVIGNIHQNPELL